MKIMQKILTVGHHYQNPNGSIRLIIKLIGDYHGYESDRFLTYMVIKGNNKGKTFPMTKKRFIDWLRGNK